MAITTYSELQTAIASWLHRSDLTSNIPDFITLAEADFTRRLRTRVMETSAAKTATAGTRAVALPTNWLQGKRTYLDTTPVRDISYMPPTDYWHRYVSTTTGMPEAYTIEGENMLLGPIPDGARVIQMLYYMRLAALSTSPTTGNGLFSANPDLYLYGSLVAAEPFVKNDKRLPLWKEQYELALSQIEAADSRDRASGSPLQVRTDYQVV